jgi:general stress protein 26
MEIANQLHQKVKVFIVSCVDQNGFPLTKAVVPAKYRESIENLYFCTNTSSRFVTALKINSNGSVYFYQKKLVGVWRGCYLQGHFEIINDITLKQHFWDDKFKGAYEQGTYLDPDFCLLKFTPINGRLYANYTLENLTFNNNYDD